MEEEGETKLETFLEILWVRVIVSRKSLRDSGCPSGIEIFKRESNFKHATYQGLLLFGREF